MFRFPKIAWITAGALFAFASLGWGTYNAVSLLAYDRYKFHETFTTTEAAAIEKIQVDNPAGSVHVIGTDSKGSIVIDGDVLRGLSKPTHSEQIKGSTLEVESSCHAASSFCNVDYTLRVPRDIALHIRASGGGVRTFGIDGVQDIASSGGGVNVEGASSTLKLDSSGGGVTATGIVSSIVEASSSGGGVRLEFERSPTHVQVSSSGGGVTVQVPDNAVPYRVDIGSTGGGTRTDVRTDPDSTRRIVAHSSGGGVTVRYPEVTAPPGR
jgi:hypothetical protein